jgi:3-hydroxybutyryl-CoA dehydrogenase
VKVDKVLVIGTGTMGSGIVQVCAQKGLKVTMIDTAQEMLDKAIKTISWSVGKLAEKGKLSEKPEDVMARIAASRELQTGADADLVIEAIFEDLKVKQELFARVEEIVGAQTVLATNTSAIPISAICKDLQRPERLLGLHFFNPVPMMDAVEVIRGVCTSDEAFEFGAEFVRFLGKEPIMVKSDIAGFVLNRANMLTNLEVMRLVENGVSTPQDIDKGFRLAFGRRMGPLETSDLVGLDVQLMAYTNVYMEERDPKFYPPGILRRKVAAGHLGRKTGKGWYEYNSDGSRKQ